MVDTHFVRSKNWSKSPQNFPFYRCVIMFNIGVLFICWTRVFIVVSAHLISLSADSRHYQHLPTDKTPQVQGNNLDIW